MSRKAPEGRAPARSHATPATFSQFTMLVTAMAAPHDKDNARPPTINEGIDEVEEHFEWLHINVDEEDGPEVMIENLASVVAACGRLADVLLAQLTVAQLGKVITENQPSSDPSA